MVMVHLQQWVGFISRHDLYTMDMNQGRNCYNCRGFGHIVQYYKKRENQRRMEQRRRLEYEKNVNNNFNREENLIVFN